MAYIAFLHNENAADALLPYINSAWWGETTVDRWNYKYASAKKIRIWEYAL